MFIDVFVWVFFDIDDCTVIEVGFIVSDAKVVVVVIVIFVINVGFFELFW